jgi:hypothetical protein
MTLEKITIPINSDFPDQCHRDCRFKTGPNHNIRRHHWRCIVWGVDLIERHAEGSFKRPEVCQKATVSDD